MPLSNQQLDDDVLTDVSAPISGVNTSMPPSAIQATQAADAENRLTQRDGLNRPRPGIIKVAQSSPTGSFDSINHIGTGVFLANSGPNWYRYDNRSNSFTTLSGGPAYGIGDQIFAALADNVLYFSDGNALNKYDPSVPGFGTVTLPGGYPTASYPIWALNRLIWCYQNTILVSDILNPEYVDVISSSVTLDPIASDVITGQALWKDQQLIVFRNGSTWLVTTGPDLAVLDWQVERISATVGCRCHGTIVQGGNDVFFLSETGRGVYAVSQAPTSDQQGVWQPISVEAQAYIDRINWAACGCARATYWNDLYMLSVPLDNFTYNNFMLIYSVALQQWQGTWCFEDANDNDLGARDFARDRTDINDTVLMIVTKDGYMSKFTYPVDRHYYDQQLDNSKSYYESFLLTRSFTFSNNFYEYNQVNQLRPHSARFQFLQSEDPVNITVIADRMITILNRTTATDTYLLSLTIPGFPFDLDQDGYKNVPFSLLHTGICTELQFQLQGDGNWTLYQVKAAMFPTMPLISV